MKENGKWFKFLPNGTKVECNNHSYAWSGRMPCTGTYSCVLCGAESFSVFVEKYGMNKLNHFLKWALSFNEFLDYLRIDEDDPDYGNAKTFYLNKAK